MKSVFRAVFLLLAGVIFSAAGALPAGKVNADKLNLRLGPGVVHPVVGSVGQGSEVRILRVLDSWLELEAPATLTAFVSEARVGADGILTGELNMRSKMSSKAPCLGVLPKGTKVERLNKRANGWVEIKIPAGAGVKVYAAGFFVDYRATDFDRLGNPVNAPEIIEDKKVAGQPAEAAVPADKKENAVPEKTADTAAEAAVPADKKADAVPEKAAEKIELQGTLVKWKYSETPETRYALLTAPDGFNQAFVTGDEKALAGAENRKVKVNGCSAGRFGNNGAIIVKAEIITVL